MGASRRRSSRASVDEAMNEQVEMLEKASKWWDEFAGKEPEYPSKRRASDTAVDTADKWWEKYFGKEPEIATCRQDANSSTSSKDTTKKTVKKKNSAEGCVQGKDPDNAVYKAIQGKCLARGHAASYFRRAVTLIGLSARL
jgi:hypothetical protein